MHVHDTWLRGMILGIDCCDAGVTKPWLTCSLPVHTSWCDQAMAHLQPPCASLMVKRSRDTK